MLSYLYYLWELYINSQFSKIRKDRNVYREYAKEQNNIYYRLKAVLYILMKLNLCTIIWDSALD